MSSLTDINADDLVSEGSIRYHTTELPNWGHGIVSVIETHNTKASGMIKVITTAFNLNK